jgi:hypothetical protein
MKQKVAPLVLACGLVWVTQQGCATNPSRQMDTAMFVPPAIGENSGGAVEPDPATVSVQLPPDAPRIESPKNAAILPGGQSKSLDPVKPLAPLQSAPSTMPVEAESTENAGSSESTATATTAPADHGGQGVYMTLGGVLAQVNDTPIYANQVLTPLKKEFNAKSKELDAPAFRDFAEQEIGRQLQELIEDELYFATAYHALNDEDRKIADAVAIQARKERVTAAGGSVEQAKRIALEDGEDFDESIKQEYRRIVHQLYQRRRIEPLIQVTADDMRDFYAANVGKLYSEKDRAQFRVIAIDPAVRGNKAAREKIEALRARAIAGEDFGKLASTENDDEFLKGRGGNPCDEGGWMEKNTYRIDAVEAAAWSVEPGQVTPVVEADGKLYIARLDAKRNGIVRPFEDQAVQDDIFNRLHQQQLGELWRKSREDSVGEAMINTDANRVQVAVDMAMQSYAVVDRH